MRLLREPLKHARTFQTHVVKVAMEVGMWSIVGRPVPIGAPGWYDRCASHKKAQDEYSGELRRSERGAMPITRRAFMGLPTSRRKTHLKQWKMAFADMKRKLLDDWVKLVEGPAP